MDVQTARERFTRHDYEQLPEGFPAQLVDGWLVRDPSPTFGHQWLVGRIYRALHALVGERAVPSPIDVGIDDYNVFQPDVVVVPEIPDLSKRDVGIPVIAFEILSRSTMRRDRGRKLPRLLAAGVREVWLVDLQEKWIERHTLDASRRVVGSERLASDAIPGLSLVPDELLAPPRS